MSRSKSSQRWLKEHHSDAFVKQARDAGYRSRACFKLIEMDRTDKLLRKGQTVIDLGAAPGGWSQVASERVMPGGRVIACDILNMDALADVDFVQGDFTDESTFDALMARAPAQGVDIVISDMAPNMSGNRAIDIPKSMYLVELAVDLAQRTLRPGGAFVTKIFHGQGFDEMLKLLRSEFHDVVVRKPDASRSRSKETYLVAKGFKGSE